MLWNLNLAYALRVQSEQPLEFSLRLRLPWWFSREARLTLNGEPLPVNSAASSNVEITRRWADDALHIVLPKSLVALPLPDNPETFGFMDGPVVQADLNPGRWTSGMGHLFGSHIPDTYSISGMTLKGDISHPETSLTTDNE